MPPPLDGTFDLAQSRPPDGCPHSVIPRPHCGCQQPPALTATLPLILFRAGLAAEVWTWHCLWAMLTRPAATVFTLHVYHMGMGHGYVLDTGAVTACDTDTRLPLPSIGAGLPTPQSCVLGEWPSKRSVPYQRVSLQASHRIHHTHYTRSTSGARTESDKALRGAVLAVHSKLGSRHI